MIHVDTSFLVDLVREFNQQQRRGPATSRLAELSQEELGVSPFVACELRAGAEQARDRAVEHQRVDALLAPLFFVQISTELPGIYGRLLGTLRGRGETIAAMDLLIASAAIADDAPLVTRDERHFARVPGLRLITY